MRIQTRLFLGTALPVLALVGAQWWLHQQQVRALEREIGVMATSVGRDVLAESLELLAPVMEMTPPGDGVAGEHFKWVVSGETDGDAPPAGSRNLNLVIVTTSDPSAEDEAREVVSRVAATETVDCASAEGEEGGQKRVFGRRVVRYSYDASGKPVVPDAAAGGIVREIGEETLHLKVVMAPDQALGEHFLVVRTDPGGEKRVPIPVLPTRQVVSTTLRQGLALGMGLLVVGLVASGVVARRLARPLEQLATGAEALGRGELGVQVPHTAAGEVGELQQAFNRMSERLAELERERDGWRQREHLAELGDLARGLAHTLRNPLNTLGLAHDELAAAAGVEGEVLAATSRSQIRRIDRWLRSFLALGAGGAARPEPVEVEAVVQEVVLEAVQQGATVELESPGEGAVVCVVPTGLRAALANLLENAVQASPAGVPVQVLVAAEGEMATVSISDRGPGLPDEVRQRLFQPHVTTRPEGSGMGLFLARQLVVASNGGTLEVTDRDGGGTVVTVSLRRVEVGEGDGDVC